MAFIKQFFSDLRTPLYKNAILLMTDTIISSVFGFLFWMVVTRCYIAHEVGLAATVIPVVGLVGTLSIFGFGEALVRFLPSSGKGSRAMINSFLTISGLAAILISLIFLAGLSIWSPTLLFIQENWIFLLSFVLFSVVITLNLIKDRVFVARRNVKLLLVSTSIGGSRILIVAFFASFFGAFGIFASWGLATLVAFLVGIFILVPMVEPGYRPIPTVKKDLVNDMLHFSAANHVSGIFSALTLAAIPLLIVNTLGAEDVAYYYIAFMIASFLFMIPMAIYVSLFVEGSHFMNELGAHVRKALKLALLIVVPLVILILFFGDRLLLFFGPEYADEGFGTLQVLAISSVFTAFNAMFMATRQVLKRMKTIVALAAFNVFAIVGFGYLFLPWMGLIGIAVAWTVVKGMISAGIGLYVLRTRWTATHDTWP